MLTVGAAIAPFAAAPARAAEDAAAAPILTSVPTSPGTDAEPTWAFTSDALTQCSFGPASAPETWLDCTSPFAGEAPDDGAYGFQVRATAGPEASAATTATYVRTTPTVPGTDPAEQADPGEGLEVPGVSSPAAPTVEGPQGAGTQARSTWNIVADPASSLTCWLITNGVAGESFSCGSLVELTLGSDATYVLRVSQTDAAGQTSPTQDSAAYTLSTPIPGVPVVSGPTGPSKESSPSWDVQAPSDGVTRCSLLRDGVVVDVVQACGPSVTFTLPADGPYVMQAVTTDGAGRTSEPGASLPYLLDTVAPSAATPTGPSGRHSDPAPSWTWGAGEAGTSVSCVLTGPDGSPVPLVCGPQGATIGSLDLEGVYRLDVALTDAAGNRSPSADVSYELDRTPPVVRGVSLDNHRERGHERSLTWIFTPEQADSARLTCTLTFESAVKDGQRRPADVSGPCSSPFSAMLPTDGPDGTYRFGVTETDEAGNVGAPTTSTYVLDTNAPELPTFTVEPMGPSRSPQVEWRLAPDADTDSWLCTLRRNGNVVGTFGCDGTSVVRDVAALGEGAYALSVAAVDDVGNVSAAVTSKTYTYSLAAPGALVWDGYPGSTLPVPDAEPGQTGSLGYAASATPFTFHAESDATFLCQLTRGEQQRTAVPVAQRPCNDAVPGTGRFALGAENAGKGGTYWLTVTTSQPGRQQAGVSVASFVLDLSAPGAPVFTSGEGHANDPRAGFTWQQPTSEAGEQYVALCRLVPLGGTAEPLGVCPQRGADDRELASPGTWTLEVRFVDRAGRQGPTSTSPAYTYDRSSPDRPAVFGPANGFRGENESVSWTFQPPSDVVLVTCRLVRGRTELVAGADCPDRTFTKSLLGEPLGTYVLTVTYLTRAGSRSSVDIPYSFGRRSIAAPTEFFPSVSGGLSPQAGGLPSASSPFDLAGPVGRSPAPKQGGVPTVQTQPKAGLPSVALVPVAPAQIPAAAGPAQPAEALPPTPALVRRLLVPGVPEAMRRAVPELINVTITRPAMPLALGALMLLFLLVHNTFDRRDPKLSDAPRETAPDLEFGPSLLPSSSPSTGYPQGEPER